MSPRPFSPPAGLQFARRRSSTHCQNDAVDAGLRAGGQRAVSAPPPDPRRRPLQPLQICHARLLVPDVQNVQQENARQEEGAVPEPGLFQAPRAAADAPGDRLRHRDQLPVLPERQQGDLHRPEPAVPEVPDQRHGGQRPPDLRQIRGGVRGGHGTRPGQFRGHGGLHPGALHRRQRAANSA